MGILSTLNRWRGKKPQVFTKMPASELERCWTFCPTRASAGVWAIRYHSLVSGLRRRPAYSLIKPVFPAPRWTCYFIYLPDAQLSEAHRFTLRKLRAIGRPILVICATPNLDRMPSDLLDLCDALFWKSLPGYDFSAYRIGLDAIANGSPHADVFVLNDSVYGPFIQLEPFLSDPPWDLTGFTAFSLVENHIQSYAFHIKDVTTKLVSCLGPAMPRNLVCDDYRSVVYLQETRLARIAAKHMSVGSFWYADAARCGDPTIYSGLDMMEYGFPFMKKSLFTRNKGLYDVDTLNRALLDRGHPLPKEP